MGQWTTPPLSYRKAMCAPYDIEKIGRTGTHQHTNLLVHSSNYIYIDRDRSMLDATIPSLPGWHIIARRTKRFPSSHFCDCCVSMKNAINRIPVNTVYKHLLLDTLFTWQQYLYVCPLSFQGVRRLSRVITISYRPLCQQCTLLFMSCLVGTTYR